ncbi:ABC transporter ATP-binding protein [Paenibacillus arenosi]|uniref:ABC transporter ATP-binding protein n=1 Tax=Paenibacillus arenosi TaxID=2774142 RepID=UPI001CDBC8A6|nr:ABC transporter ATP-binding protein [Paenibacillus arenosi]
MILKLTNITKEYNSRVILNDINLSCKNCEMIAIKGKSGVGKSTLLNIMAGLERATSGEYYYNEILMNDKSINSLSKFRQANVGYISQHSPMIPELTVLENICVPVWFEKDEEKKKEYMQQIESLSMLFEINNLLDKKINALSGGEIQRAGIIRSILKKPQLIIADEPTAALDDETALMILTHFNFLKSEGAIIIVVTHNDIVSKHCDKTYQLSKEGLLLIS